MDNRIINTFYERSLVFHLEKKQRRIVEELVFIVHLFNFSFAFDYARYEVNKWIFVFNAFWF